MSLVVRILCGLAVGVFLGLVAPGLSCIGILGRMFVSALKGIAPVLVVVLVVSSIAKAQFVDEVQTVTVCDVTFRMQLVEGGEFMMGIDGVWNRGGKFCLVYDRGVCRPEYASNAVGLRLVLVK